MTYYELVDDSAPFWFDVLTIVILWVATCVNAYLGLLRITHSHGPYAVARVIVAVGMGVLAVRFSWWMAVHGDLVLSWWASLGILFVCTGSAVLGIERVKKGRESVE